MVIGSGRDEVPFGVEGMLGAAYLAIGQPERSGRVVPRPARTRPRHPYTHQGNAWSSHWRSPGPVRRRRAAANGLIDAAEATHNPCALAYALYAYGFAFRDADPVRALEALRRGLVIAQDSGNRLIESLLATALSRLEAEHGDPLAALDHLTLAIRNFHDSGNVAYMRFALAVLAASLRPARTPRTGGHHRRFRPQSLHRARQSPEISTAIAHLRDVLGDQTYESLARKGETMTTAAMVTYAYDQIDQARAELNAVSK